MCGYAIYSTRLPFIFARATNSTRGSLFALLSWMMRRTAYPIFRAAPAAVPLFGAGDKASDLYSDEAGLPLRFRRNLKNWHNIDLMAALSAQVRRFIRVQKLASVLRSTDGFCDGL